MNMNRTIVKQQLQEASTQSIVVRIGFRPMQYPSLLLLVAALGACGPTDNMMTTADRVKIVEERQKKDPNFYLPRGNQAKPDQEELVSSSIDVVDKPVKTSSMADAKSSKLR